MKGQDLINEFLKNGDKQQAVKMSAYMRDQFLFLGIPTPLRKTLCKDFFKIIKKEKEVDWDFITACWENDYRELQYVAMEYLRSMQKHLTVQDIPKIKKLAIAKSWWDTIDGLDGIIGTIALAYPEVNDLMLAWSKEENIWLRRIAIDHQLSRNEKTDADLLARIIINNLGEKEFFINKAIGWSLRDYSKINPEWVKNFIEKNKDRMASLSIKEATKYL